MRSPRAALQRLLRFIAEPWEPTLLPADGDTRRPLQGKPTGPDEANCVLGRRSIGHWQRDLASIHRPTIQTMLDPLLKELDYTPA